MKNERQMKPTYTARFMTQMLCAICICVIMIISTICGIHSHVLVPITYKFWGFVFSLVVFCLIFSLLVEFCTFLVPIARLHCLYMIKEYEYHFARANIDLKSKSAEKIDPRTITLILFRSFRNWNGNPSCCFHAVRQFIRAALTLAQHLCVFVLCFTIPLYYENRPIKRRQQE